jgi:transcriptional regulator with PAS, ATPase and Fis domain
MQVAAELNHLKQQFGIIGNAPALNRAIEIATQVAPTELSVLITGESGTGKESFSKLIHSLSPYKHGKFIAINCGAIPEGTIDSELFGHEKGAFTGASEMRKGYFEEANGGTIFLDEIGEMPLGTQTKLLRVLEYGEFIKVGSSKIQKVKVRVIAATNVNLLDAIYKGKFREDLYYRLNTVPIQIPPLREREVDIMLLFLKFATEFADKYYIKPIQLTEDAQELLLHYRFPGNIRQLKNLVEQISVLEVERVISRKKLQTYLPSDQQVLPTLYKQANTQENQQEREFLYKLLFEMRKEMHDLEKLLFELLNNSAQGREILKTHAPLFNKVVNRLEKEALPVSRSDSEKVYEKDEIHPSYTYINHKFLPSVQDHEHTEEVKEAETEEESLSIEEKEKELIIKALTKFKHKRKKAAEVLGISERTLYRKINEYNLE